MSESEGDRPNAIDATPSLPTSVGKEGTARVDKQSARQNSRPGDRHLEASLTRGDGEELVAAARQSSAQFLWEQFRGHRKIMFILLLLLSASLGLTFFIGVSIKVTIDYLLPGKPLPEPIASWFPGWSHVSLMYLVGAMAAAAKVAESLAKIWSRTQIYRIAITIQQRLVHRVLKHSLNLPLHRAQAVKSGGFASVLRDDLGGFAEFIMDFVYQPWRAGTIMLGALIVMCYLDWRLLMALLIVAPVIYITQSSWSRLVRPIYFDIAARNKVVDAALTETFSGLRVVRAFARVRAETVRLLRQHRKLAQLGIAAWRARNWNGLFDIVAELVSLAVLTYGGVRVLQGELSLGDLVTFLGLLGFILSPIDDLANSIYASQRGVAALHRIQDLLAEPTEHISSENTTILPRSRVKGTLAIRDVSFEYPGSRESVLKHVSIEIRAGETIAIVGGSGAGKTTLTNLIARFYDPTSGNIQLDGRDVRSIHINSYRKLLGIVDQDVFLFDGSIADNISYAAPKSDRRTIEEAARAAHLAEFIEQLPQGYDTQVGERGVCLSGGQRQRLAIARAIVADPRILIFDEATSNLDGASEEAIQQGLKRLTENRTCILVAHRLRSIAEARRIVVLNRGSVVDIGSQEELLDRCEYFRFLFATQLAPVTPPARRGLSAGDARAA